MRQGVLHRSPAPALVPRGAATEAWSAARTEQAQASSASAFGGPEKHLLDSSSSMVPLHVNSIEAALAQRAQPSTAALRGTHRAGTAVDSERWHPELRYTPPLQALPDGGSTMHPHASGAAEATNVAVARRRASLNIALPADERALRAVPMQDSYMRHADHAGGPEWSRLDEGQERWTSSSTPRNARSDAGWSRTSDRLSAGMPQHRGAPWVGLGLEDGENSGMSMLQPKPDMRAAEEALQMARDEAAAHAAELLRLRASYAEAQSQVEARRVGHNRMTSPCMPHGGGTQTIM